MSKVTQIVSFECMDNIIQEDISSEDVIEKCINFLKKNKFIKFNILEFLLKRKFCNLNYDVIPLNLEDLNNIKNLQKDLAEYLEVFLKQYKNNNPNLNDFIFKILFLLDFILNKAIKEIEFFDLKNLTKNEKDYMELVFYFTNFLKMILQFVEDSILDYVGYRNIFSVYNGLLNLINKDKSEKLMKLFLNFLKKIPAKYQNSFIFKELLKTTFFSKDIEDLLNKFVELANDKNLLSYEFFMKNIAKINNKFKLTKFLKEKWKIKNIKDLNDGIIKEIYTIISGYFARLKIINTEGLPDINQEIKKEKIKTESLRRIMAKLFQNKTNYQNLLFKNHTNIYETEENILNDIYCENYIIYYVILGRKTSTGLYIETTYNEEHFPIKEKQYYLDNNKQRIISEKDFNTKKSSIQFEITKT
jgi:hypothetical protein